MSLTLSSITDAPIDQCRHPGELLAEELAVVGMSVMTLARASGIPAAHLVEIVGSQRPVTPDVALRLADHFGTSARFWLNRQAAYDRAARLGGRPSTGLRRPLR